MKSCNTLLEFYFHNIKNLVLIRIDMQPLGVEIKEPTWNYIASLSKYDIIIKLISYLELKSDLYAVLSSGNEKPF